LRSRYIEEVVVSGGTRGPRGSAAGERRQDPGQEQAPGTRGPRTQEPSPCLAARDDVVVSAEIYPDADAVRRDFGDASADDVRKIIDREIDRANESLPPHMRVLRVVLRDAPFDKTTTKKIKRPPAAQD
jgi:hypothetical protein